MNDAVARPSSVFHEPVHHLQRQRENDGGVLLGSDGVEGLQVAQLQGGRRLRDHKGGLLQRPGRVHLSLRCNHLEEEREVTSQRVRSVCTQDANAVRRRRVQIHLARQCDFYPTTCV